MSIALASLNNSPNLDKEIESCIIRKRGIMDVFNITMKRRPLGFKLTSGIGKTAAYVTETETQWNASLPVNSKLLKVSRRHVEMLQSDKIIDQIVNADLPFIMTFCRPEGLHEDEFPDPHAEILKLDKEKVSSIITRERDTNRLFMIILRTRPSGFFLTPGIGGSAAYVTKKAVRWDNIPLNSKLLKVNDRDVEKFLIHDILDLINNAPLPVNLTFCEPEGLYKDEFADPDAPPPPDNIFQVEKETSSDDENECKWWYCFLVPCVFCKC